MHAVHSDQLSMSALCADITPEMVAQAVHLSKRRQTFAAPALSKTNLLAAAAEAAARGAAEGDGGLINYVGLTDTCDEKGIDVFGAPALAQLDVAMKEITALLEGALEKVKYDRGTAIERAANNPDHSAYANLARLEGMRRRLAADVSAFGASVLLLLMMVRHYSTAEQQKALGEIRGGGFAAAGGALSGAGISLVGDGLSGAAARIQSWPRSQLAMISDMRAMWVARGNRLLRGRRRGSVSRTSMIALEQADASGTDTTLGKSQQQILKELGAFKTPTPGTPSAADTTSGRSGRRGSLDAVGTSPCGTPAASARTESREAVAHFCDESFTPEVALDEEKHGAVVEELEAATTPPTWERALDIAQELSLDEPVVFVDVGRTLEASAVRVGLECEAVAEMGGKEEPFGVALRLVLTQPTGADRVKRLFNCDLVNVQGVYSLQLYAQKEHRWETLVIDDRLPCAAPIATTSIAQPPRLVPWHARSSRDCEMWASLLHKAAAKLAGSYHALAKRPVPEIVVMLVGGLLQPIPRSAFAAGPNGEPPAVTWANLRLFVDAGCLLLCEPAAEGGVFMRGSSIAQSGRRTDQSDTGGSIDARLAADVENGGLVRTGSAPGSAMVASGRTTGRSRSRTARRAS